MKYVSIVVMGYCLFNVIIFEKLIVNVNDRESQLYIMLMLVVISMFKAAQEFGCTQIEYILA